MAVDEATGDLLHGPNKEPPVSLERLPSSYKPFNTFTLEKEKQYQQQYGDMYFLRLTKLKPAVEAIAAEAWGDLRVGAETAKKVDRVLDVRQGELCWMVGTIYMEMPLKPNILEDISKDHWISAPPPREKYLSPDGEDQIVLEDESGRVRLIGSTLHDEMLVTGCIIGVLGTENANGDFDLMDIKVPDLPPQLPRWSDSKSAEPQKKKRKLDEEKDKSQSSIPVSGSKIALVSGLGISGTSTAATLQTDLLLEYLLGESLSPNDQQSSSQISRLIIAGNSITTSHPGNSHDTIGNARKAGGGSRKYGYDSSAYNPAPTAHFDQFLADVLTTMPVTLIPGASDPANVSMPQQPIHSAMFPRARNYGAMPDTTEPGWFDAVTNPWEGEVDGWRVLGTGGQNIDDIFKYVESEDRLRMMEAMCRWRCCAPTAPDTLWSYPFQDKDPFVIQSCPHVFFVGSQPKFDTALLEGPHGQTVRLIALPRFDETGELVLVDSETLEVERVKIEVFEGGVK